MSFFTVVERRAIPESLERLVATFRTLARDYPLPGVRSHQLYLGERDPARVLIVTRWPSPEAFRAARDSTAAPGPSALAPLFASPTEDVEMYRLIREIRDMGRRTRLSAARRCRVSPPDRAAWIGWANGMQDAVIHLDGVTAVTILEAIDRPDDFLLLSEYADPAARGAGRDAFAASPAPVPFESFPPFVGRLAHAWDLLDTLRDPEDRSRDPAGGTMS